MIETDRTSEHVCYKLHLPGNNRLKAIDISKACACFILSAINCNRLCKAAHSWCISIHELWQSSSQERTRMLHEAAAKHCLSTWERESLTQHVHHTLAPPETSNKWPIGIMSVCMKACMLCDCPPSSVLNAALSHVCHS